ncbi:hypothetical protein, partial [Mesorhizobium japonicum]|uniref:hypothetical protein n=1 Tax=Mesorhizobium japonicum TaxID=2066070 RepID=UPI003B58DF66
MSGAAFRLPPAFTLWAPVVLSFAVQVPAAFWFALHGRIELAHIALLVGVALVGPLALIAARRLPGPVVA